MARTRVTAKVVFPALHCWPAAPAPVAYLRHPHRHLFVIRATVEVTHDDRDVEFIMLGEQVLAQVAAWYPDGDLGHTSCEMLARRLLEHFDLIECSVFEDDENGATVSR